VIAGSNLLIQVQESSEGDMNMCTALERLEERGREAGRIEGREEGRAEGKREILFALLKAGAEVRLLKEVSGLSEEEIVALGKEIK
jgi:predicted transposase/invertase (TIGR01784 family)